MCENDSYEIADNGEDWLLGRLSGSIGPDACIFDVGANVGKWSAAARRRFPQAEIHAFEAVPATVRDLANLVVGDERLRVVASGLGESRQTSRLKCYDGRSTIASIVDFPHDSPHSWIEVEIQRGDEYCAAHGIGSVDLLKIDTEGNDFRVLEGFGEMLTNGTVKVVQFEYGLSSIVTKFLLRDFYEMFIAAGFVVGKLYPDHVDFRAYDMSRDENFLGPNYVAVRRERDDLVRVLRR